MRKFSRFFVFLLFSGLFTAYAPIIQADMQQQGTAYAPSTQGGGYQHRSFGNSYGSKVGNKALNAFANLSTSVLELPKNIINTSNKSNFIYGITGGLVKGVINIIGRVAVGVTDLVTFPIPTRPIAQPVYIWNDFDVDTNYGPVFRLDLDEEEETPAVQSPVAEPVAAPAVVAPRPEPIDNSKQYKQETNHKLDEMFKKEMKK